MTIQGADVFHSTLDEFLDSEDFDSVTLNARLQDALDSLQWLRNRTVHVGTLVGVSSSTVDINVPADGQLYPVLMQSFPGMIAGSVLLFHASVWVAQYGTSAGFVVDYSDDGGATWTSTAPGGFHQFLGAAVGYHPVFGVLADAGAVVHTRVLRISARVLPSPIGTPAIVRSSDRLGLYLTTRGIS